MAGKKKEPVWQLKLHDGSKEVLDAQKMLATLGSTVQATGVYSIGTMSAVRSFQKKNGLDVTGIIDKKTWDRLYALTHTVKRTPAKKGAAKK